jgi:hypothetical protein
LAGYIFNLGGNANLPRLCREGVYGTIFKPELDPPTRKWDPGGTWHQVYVATLGDYVTMQPGDAVYFFSNRNIYGIGRLTEVGGDCRHLNFPQASEARAFNYGQVKDDLLNDHGASSVRQRWLCTFVPDPLWFRDGVDMDDLLSSDPGAFRMLRAMHRRSFIKFDDDEAQAFRNMLLRRNEHVLAAATGPDVLEFSPASHDALAAKRTRAYDLSLAPVLEPLARGAQLSQEMAVEVALLDHLRRREVATREIFGHWDYLSHQVLASPFKPLDYADMMDVFGYRYVSGHAPTISRYLVAEVKRGRATVTDVEQTLRYVDWVKDEYAQGDYSMIEAFLVASTFTDDALERLEKVAVRSFTVERRPPRTEHWRGLRLVRYRYDNASENLAFEAV